MGLKMSLNIEQAAWYIERDGARRVRTESDGTDIYQGDLGSSGSYTFRVGPEDQSELNRRRDRVYGLLRDRARKDALR